MALLSSDRWEYRPREQGRKQDMWALGSTAFLIAASAALIPASYFFGLMAYGVVTTAYRARTILPYFAEREFKKLIETNRVREVRRSGYAHIFRFMERAMDMVPSRGLFVANEQFVRELWESRDRSLAEIVLRKFFEVLAPKMLRTSPGDYTKAGKKLFLAASHLDMVITTEAALKHHTRDVNNLILAHELVHLKNRDGFTPRAFCETFVREIGGVTGCIAVLIFGGAPVAAMTAGLVYLVSKAADLGLKKASRNMECMADRGALFLSRDFEAAQAKLRKWRYYTYPNRVEQILCTHPLGLNRHDNYVRAWEEVKQYKPLRGSFVKAASPSPFTVGVKQGVRPWKPVDYTLRPQ